MLYISFFCSSFVQKTQVIHQVMYYQRVYYRCRSVLLGHCEMSVMDIECIYIMSFFISMRGYPKITRIFFWRGEGRYFRLLRLDACMWLPAASVGHAAFLGKGLHGQCDFFLSLCHGFHRFFDGRLKRVCLHQVLFPFGENGSRNCHNASRGF